MHLMHLDEDTSASVAQPERAVWETVTKRDTSSTPRNCDVKKFCFACEFFFIRSGLHPGLPPTRHHDTLNPAMSVLCSMLVLHTKKQHPMRYSSPLSGHSRVPANPTLRRFDPARLHKLGPCVRREGFEGVEGTIGKIRKKNPSQDVVETK